MLRKNGALAKAVSVAQNYELQMEDPMTTFASSNTSMIREFKTFK